MYLNMARHWSRTYIFLAVFKVVILPAVCRNHSTCYSCHVEPGRNVCADANLLMQERHVYDKYNKSHDLQNFRSDLIINCTTSNPKCVIETIIDGDKSLKLMYRDCSDGSRFSTNVSGTRLEKMEADNHTHCAYRHEILASVCISICDGDLCNGPFSKAAVIGWHQCHVLMLISAMAGWLCFVRFR